MNQTSAIDYTLDTGTVNQTVTVQATAVALETSTSELGVAIVRQEVNNLPLNGRNFTQLLDLTPGVSTINVSQNAIAEECGRIRSGHSAIPAINGQTNRSDFFLLDGVNNQGSFGSTYAVAPILDDIQEFKVQSHNDDASFGGSLGGIINVVTKSGTAAVSRVGLGVLPRRRIRRFAYISASRHSLINLHRTNLVAPVAARWSFPGIAR